MNTTTSSEKGHPNAARGGFTIVEVVLAMGILVMGATAIIAFLTYGAATARHAQLRQGTEQGLGPTALGKRGADLDPGQGKGPRRKDIGKRGKNS